MNLKDMAQGIGVTVVDPADSPREAIFDDHERVVSKFIILVASIRTLLEHESKPIVHFPVSQGKDSTLCELAGLEAYRQCIAEGTIEPERPMVLTTVDTKVEQTPMRMYVRYCKSRVEEYAQKCGINLDYQLVMPNLTSEYFVKWGGAQKIIGNASRNGDCSVILKIDPNTKHLRSLSDEYPGYERSHFISVVGSRHEESSRRSANIKKSKMVESAEDLFDGMETESVGGTVIHSYAGIADWTTDDVFLALHLAGEQPKTAYQGKRGSTVIPSFLPHHELLVEIYGNGSNETCSISTGAKGGSGCNGKARYGCSTCTYTGFTDKSSEALTAYPRWHFLGAEKALRLRDYFACLPIWGRGLSMLVRSIR
ncbi:hypothetical protein AB6D11_00795 [Vibrio splendidus]